MPELVGVREISTLGREGDAGIEIGGLERGVLAENLLPALPGAQELQDRLRGDPLATDRGFAVADFRIDGDPVQKLSCFHGEVSYSRKNASSSKLIRRS